MIPSAIALVLAALPLSSAGEVRTTCELPPVYIKGLPYTARVVIDAPGDETQLQPWMLTPAGFSVDGAPLGPRDSARPIQLAPSSHLVVEVALMGALEPRELKGDFDLAYGSAQPQRVRVLEAAPATTDFMESPAAELGNWWVLLDTNQGRILVELWPDVAPNHVRNFLDLAQTHFYDGVGFHRVIPGFMIQGGDPTGTGGGNGKRTLQAEFNDKKHERGVLSMARTNDPNSASCQFFIVHAASSHLDRQYTAFGRVVQGLPAVDRIASCKAANTRPSEPQVIQRAVVVRAPADRDSWRDAAPGR